MGENQVSDDSMGETNWNILLVKGNASDSLSYRRHGNNEWQDMSTLPSTV
jgi:hypothetical protein